MHSANNTTSYTKSFADALVYPYNVTSSVVIVPFSLAWNWRAHAQWLEKNIAENVPYVGSTLAYIPGIPAHYTPDMEYWVWNWRVHVDYVAEKVEMLPCYVGAIPSTLLHELALRVPNMKEMRMAVSVGLANIFIDKYLFAPKPLKEGQIAERNPTELSFLRDMLKLGTGLWHWLCEDKVAGTDNVHGDGHAASSVARGIGKPISLAASAYYNKGLKISNPTEYNSALGRVSMLSNFVFDSVGKVLIEIEEDRQDTNSMNITFMRYAIDNCSASTYSRARREALSKPFASTGIGELSKKFLTLGRYSNNIADVILYPCPIALRSWIKPALKSVTGTILDTLVLGTSTQITTDLVGKVGVSNVFSYVTSTNSTNVTSTNSEPMIDFTNDTELEDLLVSNTTETQVVEEIDEWDDDTNETNTTEQPQPSGEVDAPHGEDL